MAVNDAHPADRGQRSVVEEFIHLFQSLFRMLSNASVAVAALLAAVYGVERLRDPTFSIAPRAVIILLILLNARQNLRQHKYAVILEKLTRSG